MSTPNDTGGAAYPSETYNGHQTGMTWLDACAMRIAPVLLADACSKNSLGSMQPEELARTMAKASYGIALAMLTEKRRIEGKGDNKE